MRFSIPTPWINPEKHIKPYKRFGYVVLVSLFIFSIAAYLFYQDQGLILAYNDARSRLNIARRVFDSLQPGFAQIGSVWLPLYHVLELPFVWNYYFWQGGLAGSIPSMASYILGGIYLYKLCKILKFDIRATILAFLVYSLNPNLLFMQAIPMTESLLIFLSLAVVYHLVSWTKNENSWHLVGAALFTFMSTLTRYDGWFLAMFSVLAVAAISYRKRGFKFSEGNTILFISLAGFGVAIWLLWNLLIFGDPFYFALGPFSAKAQQDVLEAEGRLFSKGDIVYSFFLYLLAVKHNIGAVIGVLSGLGAWLFIRSRKFSFETKIATSLLLVPFVFNVFSLFIGHSVIHLPELPPYTWFNDRYGLMVLPAVAVTVGYVANKRSAAFIVTLIIILSQTYLTYANNRIITVEDGVRGASGDFLHKAGDWIAQNADDGLILVAASSNDALLYQSGLPLKRFIVEGALLYWEQAMSDPTISAEWIIMHKGDLVYQNMIENDRFLNNYKLVYRDDFSYIYKKDLSRLEPLDGDELP